MYVPYRCCEKSLEDHYSHQTGQGLNFYQGSNFQRGYGLGGIFRSLFRAATPLLKSGAKTIGKQMLQSGLEMVKDVSQGQNLKMAVKRRMKEAAHQLTDKAAKKMKTMIGSGRNKKRKRNKKRVSSRSVKKVKTRDIFS